LTCEGNAFHTEPAKGELSMRPILRTASALAFAAMSAAALDSSFVSQMQTTAHKLEREATGVHRALKSKRHDANEVKAKIDAMASDVEALQKLVKDFEATNPQLSSREQADWAALRNKVEVLGIFHENKRRLATEDLAKHRGQIRAFADGVALRARKLQVSAAQLQRGPVS
jgi:TolA-binding protein